MFIVRFPIDLGLRCVVRQALPPGARYQGGGKVASRRRRGLPGLYYVSSNSICVFASDVLLSQKGLSQKGTRRDIFAEPAVVKGRTTHDRGFRRDSNPLVAFLFNVFSPVYFAEQSKSPPSPAAMKFAYPFANCPRNLSVVTDLPRGMGGTLPLALGHKSISQPKPLSPLST